MQEEYKGLKRLKIFFIVVAIYIVFSRIFYGFAIVNGQSMEKTLYQDAICILKSYPKEIMRFDIVKIKTDQNVMLIKRVIGLPNEQVEIKSGSIYINGNKLEEYNDFTAIEQNANNVWTLGENEYFVLGDNRDNSLDSRVLGVIHKEYIKGKVVKILWEGKKEDV